MHRVKPISFVTVAVAFLVAVGVGGVEAGALQDSMLLVDTVVNMGFDEGMNTVPPSMAMAGDTVKVELYVKGGGGQKAVGLDAKFGAALGEMMIPDAAWGIVGASTIFPLELKVGPHAVQVAALPSADIPANGYIGTVKIVGAADAPEGASFYVKSAVIALADGSADSLDVSGAIVTVAAPSGPSIMGMGDALMAGNMLQIPGDGGNVEVTVALENVMSDTPSVSWTVTQEGEGTLSILDKEGMMLELDDMMMLMDAPTKIVLKVTGGSLAVTVKATVDGHEVEAVTFTFTQLNPAELASFDGAMQTDRVVLNWSTVSQTNNAGWRVMRSVDGENFESVGNFVQGAGTSDALMNYSFEDQNLPGVDKVYYRLEQVDLDGSVSQSNVIEVLLGARMPLPTEFAVNVYPNPFNPSTTISYELPESAPVSVVIYDVLGQQVRQLISQFNSAGRYSVQWDARDNQGRGVASGVYIARVEAGTSTLSQKMLLLK
ncbi:MAG: T9SS type A sorting domain-containing protein [Gemmatimonadetes bacterium]|nr:T9SS type A sorting domain-containing protein [Gemmatimonadota bacterium]